LSKPSGRPGGPININRPSKKINLEASPSTENTSNWLKGDKHRAFGARSLIVSNPTTRAFFDSISSLFRSSGGPKPPRQTSPIAAAVHHDLLAELHAPLGASPAANSPNPGLIADADGFPTPPANAKEKSPRLPRCVTSFPLRPSAASSSARRAALPVPKATNIHRQLSAAGGRYLDRIFKGEKATNFLLFNKCGSQFLPVKFQIDRQSQTAKGWWGPPTVPPLFPTAAPLTR